MTKTMTEDQEIRWRKLFLNVVEKYFTTEMPDIPAEVFVEMKYELADKLFEAYEIEQRMDTN